MLVFVEVALVVLADSVQVEMVVLEVEELVVLV